MLSQHLCAPLEQWDDALLSREAAETRLGPMAATEGCRTAQKNQDFGAAWPQPCES